MEWRVVSRWVAFGILCGFGSDVTAQSTWQDLYSGGMHSQSSSTATTVITEGPNLKHHETTEPYYINPIAADSDNCHSGRGNRDSGLFDELNVLIAIDGSKQPQDFGVNAYLGGQASANWGIPLIKEYGIGAQVGSGVTTSASAVRVFELLGESTGRTQSFTTLGLFQRTESGLAWGFVHDFLYEKSFDTFSLGQWRLRGSYSLSLCNEIGVTSTLRSYDDTGIFSTSSPVKLQSINQGSIYYRRFWDTGVQTTAWVGLADEHGENNAVTGPSPSKDFPFLFGADIFMPLTASLSIYGETNMIMPSDTGTVDAFLGIQWSPKQRTKSFRRSTFNPLLPLAAPTSFAVDLLQ